MAVFDPERHETLTDASWSPERAHEEIEAIAGDFAGAIRPDGSWPKHPYDNTADAPRWAQYHGAAGAVTALGAPHRAGYRAPDLSPALPAIHRAFLASPDEGPQTGLQLGETGVLAPAVLADPEGPLAERLRACMRATLGHSAREITSGETGVMHAALTLHRATGDTCWRDLYLDAAHSLFESWHEREEGVWLWRGEIFGSVRHYYGACHGVAGNVGALLRGAELLPAAWAGLCVSRLASTLERGALREGDDLNWPVSRDASGTRRLLHWCHGAPGVVTSLAGTLPKASPDIDRLERLLVSAAELVWRAGPLHKGPGICHGTAGNGYAFLLLYRRSGDAHWLERARRFAMHAIEQSRRTLARRGRRRYTLWTGDGGLALYLHHCLHPEATVFPGLELL